MDTVTTPRPWPLELILVDLRHAFWPWLAYLAACALIFYLPLPIARDEPTEQLRFTIYLIVALSVPALISAIFTADFSHSTAQTLLTFPRNRSIIWLVRIALVLLLLLVPLAAAFLLSAAFKEFLMRVHVTTLLLSLYCYVTFGPLIATLLRKGLLVWSAVMITPLVLLIVFVILQSILGIEIPSQMSQSFPYHPPFLFWFFIITGIPAAIFAYYKWIHLEVRS